MSRALLACLLALQTLACCQDAHPVTGRQTAPVMGMAGAPWLVRPEREAEEAPDAALDAINAAIGIPKGAVVADIGAGVGYFTWRLAARIGPEGKVYAVDIQQAMLDRLRHNMAERKLANYEAVLGAEDDPRLPAGRIDLALLVDVYHEFSQPQKMLRKIRVSLKPDGRMVLLEYRKEDPQVPILPAHKMSVAEVKAEIEPEGFRLEKTLENLRAHRAFRHDLVVDVELGRAQRLMVRAGFLPGELHAERVLAGFQCAGDKLLFRFDPQKVVNVVQLLVLDEQGVAAEARTVGKDHAGGVRIGDFDVREDLVRTATHVDGNALRDGSRAGVVNVSLAGRFLGGTSQAENLYSAAVVERQHQVLLRLFEPVLDERLELLGIFFGQDRKR